MALKDNVLAILQDENKLREFVDNIENSTSMQYTASVYLFLETMCRCNKTDSAKFQNVYRQFYGMNRWTDSEFHKVYFKLMADYEVKSSKKDTKTIITNIQNELPTKSIQFSFITKLLNIIDDKKYPIYDQFVDYAFKWRGVVKSTPSKEEQMDYYLKKYEHIIEEYKQVLDNNKVVKAWIESVQKQPLSEGGYKGLSDMRLLDILIWQIGKSLKPENNGEENRIPTAVGADR